MLLVGSALHLTPEQLIYLINADLFTSGIASFVQAYGAWCDMIKASGANTVQVIYGCPQIDVP